MNNRKKIVILFFIIISSVIIFQTRCVSLINEFKKTAFTKEQMIKEHITVSRNFVKSMKIFSDAYFEREESNESGMHTLLRYDMHNNSYNLNIAGGSSFKEKMGNLTGTGTIPKDKDTVKELELAMEFNKFFSSFYDEFSDVAWIYYTSEKNFINLYPWISSDKFSYSEKLKTVDFYTVANPRNNPTQDMKWTSVYLDRAGKGYMVTLSAPIYDKGVFKGVVSFDLTNALLSKIINSEYDSYLIDNTNTVLAASGLTAATDSLINITDLLKIREKDIDKIKKLENNKVERVGLYYVNTFSFEDAPWKFFMRVPVWTVWGSSLIPILPIVIIGILFLSALIEIDKRKLTEKELANSLKELKSYQRLLEKVATYDYLTNTVNRRGLKERFRQITKDCGDISPLSVVSFIIGDIDHFKNFNDTQGHAAGDRVLVEIAEFMKRATGPRDTVCRWGGEEFVIMLPGKTYMEAMAIAENLRKGIEEIVIPWNNLLKLRTTMTFGVQEGSIDKMIDQTIEEADYALYVGKRSGRNRVAGYRECRSSTAALPPYNNNWHIDGKIPS